MNAGTLSFPRVLACDRSCDSTIPVPHGSLPVIGRFSFYSDNGMLTINFEETSLNKDVLCHVSDEEEFTDEPFTPEGIEKCIIMIPFEMLNKTLGLEIQTEEGWRWNPETLENQFSKRPDGDHKWNPFSKTWEKVCDECSELLHRNQDYDLLDYMTEDNLFGVNAEVPLCECDRCPRCNRFQYIDPFCHDACESRH